MTFLNKTYIFVTDSYLVICFFCYFALLSMLLKLNLIIAGLFILFKHNDKHMCFCLIYLKKYAEMTEITIYD